VATVRTLQQLIDAFPDNKIGSITAARGRDLIASSFGYLATRHPTATDDNANTGGTGAYFDAGSRWVDTSDHTFWFCSDGTATAAQWDNVSQVAVRRNSGGSTAGPQPRLNFVEGAGISIGVLNDAINTEVDITISAVGGGITGSGTAGRLTVFTGGSTIGNSVLSQTGSGVSSVATFDGVAATTAGLAVGLGLVVGTSGIFGGGVTIGGTLGVTGATSGGSAAWTGGVTIGGTLGVTGATSGGSAAWTGGVTIGGTLGVTGAITGSSATFSGAVSAGSFVGAVPVGSLPGVTPVALGATLTNLPGVAAWYSLPLAYTNFSSGNTQTITVLTVPSDTVVHASKLVPTTLFTGPSITTYNLQLGKTGLNSQYSATIDAHAGASLNAVFMGNFLVDGLSHTASTNLTSTAQGGPPTLNNATAGAATVWFLLSRAN
jgi:hypothetical protein